MPAKVVDDLARLVGGHIGPLVEVALALYLITTLTRKLMHFFVEGRGAC
jgi:hypothetical protein